MRHHRALAGRQKLLDRLPVTGEILRGSLLKRTIRNHSTGCAKCASGEGHPLSVLTVSYPGGRTRGDTRADGKILSLFEPATEVIRKGKAGKPNEFGKMVKLQEAENQIVTDYEVYD